VRNARVLYRRVCCVCARDLADCLITLAPNLASKRERENRSYYASKCRSITHRAKTKSGLVVPLCPNTYIIPSSTTTPVRLEPAKMNAAGMNRIYISMRVCVFSALARVQQQQQQHACVYVVIFFVTGSLPPPPRAAAA
jgi:hypothetical protein